MEWYSQTTPQVVAADAPALEDSATEEGVQKDWHQLLSLPSGGQDNARASTAGDGAGVLPIMFLISIWLARFTLEYQGESKSRWN